MNYTCLSCSYSIRVRASWRISFKPCFLRGLTAFPIPVSWKKFNDETIKERSKVLKGNKSVWSQKSWDTWQADWKTNRRFNIIQTLRRFTVSASGCSLLNDLNNIESVCCKVKESIMNNSNIQKIVFSERDEQLNNNREENFMGKT